MTTGTGPLDARLPQKLPPCAAPDRLLAPQSGVFLLVFNDRPNIKSFFQWYFPLGLVGYCAFVALAHSLQWPWLRWWIDIWRPVVRLLREFIPLFDNFTNALVAKGAGFRVDAILHLLAVNWVVASAIFAYMVWIVLHLTRSEWCRLVVVAPRWFLTLMFIGAAVFFCTTLYWTTIGFALSGGYQILFAYDRSDVAFVGIGMFFYFVVLCGFGVVVSLGALIVGAPKEENMPVANE
jgi:hypothetical protein